MTGYVPPMLAARQPENIDAYFSREDWLMEEKFNGHRAIVHVDKNYRVMAWSRPKDPRAVGQTRQLPLHIVQAFRSLPKKALPATFDAEDIVRDGACWDVRRKGDTDKQLAIFDCMVIMGEPVLDRPLSERKGFLETLKPCLEDPLLVVDCIYNPTRKELEAIWTRGGEGAILKNTKSRYLPGHRLLTGWIKVKRQFKEVGMIVGFKKGQRGAHSTVLVQVDKQIIKAKAQPELLAVGKDAIGMMTLIRHSGVTPSGRFQHPQAYFTKKRD